MHDAGHVTAVLDLGFEVAKQERLELAGVKLPDPTSDEGRKALAYVMAWLVRHAPPFSRLAAGSMIALPTGWLWIRTRKDPSSGRYQAYVEQYSQVLAPELRAQLNRELVETRNATIRQEVTT